MLQSMTGFATQTVVLEEKDEKVHVSLQLKTLNGRYFEANCRLPHALSHLEIDLIKLFKKSLRRGTVYFTAYVDNQSFFKGDIVPGMGTVTNYVKALKTIQKKFEVGGDISLEIISRLPNVFVDEEKPVDERHIAAIMQSARELVNRVVADREKEGASIQKDVQERVTVMRKDIEKVEKLSEEMVTEQKEKTNQILNELSGDASELAEMRRTAVYALLDKIDIHEEISRFKAHLANLASQLTDASIEKGKKLDFTLQEMAREVNTIAAKCSSSTIGTIAINLKVEIEKAREQAQNIV